MHEPSGDDRLLLVSAAEILRDLRETRGLDRQLADVLVRNVLTFPLIDERQPVCQFPQMHHGHVVQNGKLQEHALFLSTLGDHSDAELDRIGGMTDRGGTTPDFDRPRGHPIHPEDALQQLGPSGAGEPRDPQDLPAV